MRSRWVPALVSGLGLLLLAAPVRGGAYEDGLAAVRAGDGPNAARLLRPLAEGGDPEAQYLLGAVYDAGMGLPEDNALALEWYRRAASQGSPAAQFRLGVMHYRGEGVPRDPAAAAAWFEKTAARGYADPWNNLGGLYLGKAGEFANDQLGIYSYKKAAQNGDREAQFLLALKFDQPGSLYENHSLALHWYREAALQKQPDALAVLGLKTALGDGTEPNLTEGVDALYEAGQRFLTSNDRAKALAVLTTLKGLAPDSIQTSLLATKIAEAATR